jgi:anti-sigma-K factor RskA
MNKIWRAEACNDHQAISELIPWYVNATLDESERRRVEKHLDLCATCRDDVHFERQVFKAIDKEASVEYIPMASLKRLQARLGELPGALGSVSAQQRGRAMPWRGFAAASIAVVAVAGFLSTDKWFQSRARSTEPNYRTVTSAATRPRDEVIRAVFTPTITLVELQAILDEAQLRIISGPTEAGVYSLAAKSGVPVKTSLALLRAHSTVRFAEETRVEPKADNSP